MMREDDRERAFKNAVRRDDLGRYIVSTEDFVSELARLDWHLTPKEANRWVEIHTTIFRDVSTQEGEARLFQVFDLQDEKRQ
ncbi:DNA polymerase V [Pantoea sp. KPR_PJ]|uniref:DNA polymerase V n=1 Tax=Pantoea sp. KPR_PJ TaxID=2738375 RepID=UPI0035296B2F